MASGWSDGPVPDRFTGLWQRLSIEQGDGSGDIETFVVWLQTGDVFIDLRIPPRPAGPAPAGFDELTPEAARALAAQEGFAGRLLWTEGRVAWPRALDFRPLGGVDEGAVARNGRVLVETGVHSVYVEHWWQAIEGSAPPLWSLFEPSTGAYIAMAGDHVMFAKDSRPASPAPGALGPLAEAAAAAGDAAGLAALLGCEVSYGLRAPEGGWRVLRSTLPWVEGELRPMPAGWG